MLLLERLEREYLADRSGMVTAAMQSGEEEYTPPTFDERREEFDTALATPPVPLSEMSDRERSNRLFLKSIVGGAE